MLEKMTYKINPHTAVTVCPWSQDHRVLDNQHILLPFASFQQTSQWESYGEGYKLLSRHASLKYPCKNGHKRRCGHAMPCLTTATLSDKFYVLFCGCKSRIPLSFCIAIKRQPWATSCVRLKAAVAFQD